jgi:hypothetical protein
MLPTGIGCRAPRPKALTLLVAFVFEWDPRKAARNFAKHGVTFLEAASAFDDPHSLTVSDPTHSMAEERYLLLGMSGIGRLLVVAHTERADEIRLISVRIATRTERLAYEER